MPRHVNFNQFVPINLVSAELISDITRAARLQTVPKGTLIFKRGKTLSDYYYLVEGEIDLINRDFGVEKVIGGDERSFHTLNARSPTMVSAIAKTQVTYFVVNGNLVDKTVSATQDLAMRAASASDDGGDDSVIDIGMQVGEIQDSADWMSCLLQSPLFSRIPMTQLQELFGKFEKIYARKGETIVKEGARGDYFYVVASGEALVSNRSGSVEVELSPGDYFGEEALISDAPRNATVTMSRDGMLKRLNQEDFASLVKEPVLQYISLTELKSLKAGYKIIDVRLPIEYRSGHIPGSINLPLSRLRDSVGELGRTNTYVVSGDAGARADIAAYLLCQAGFDVIIVKTEVESGNATLSNAS